MTHRYRLFFAVLTFLLASPTRAQDIRVLVGEARARLDQVRDYVAEGTMKVQVDFLKIPVTEVKAYYRKPGQFRLRSQQGVSFVPRGASGMNPASVINGEEYTIIDAGEERIGTTRVRVAKLLPLSEESGVVLTTLYIDPATKLIRRSRTFTREEGTYEVDMTYGAYTRYGLPDQLVFIFQAGDYKLPKGITFDFEGGAAPPPGTKPASGKNNKGRAELRFRKYVINQGVNDAAFR